MTCEQFARRTDAILGDLAQPPTLVGEAHRHAAQCPRCRRRWARAKRLVRVGLGSWGDEPSAAVLQQARSRLQRALEASGRPVVRFDSLRTPVGTIFVGVSDRGVCDVTVDETSTERYRRRLGAWASDARRDRHAVAAVLEQMEAYFDGSRRRFSVPVDLRRVTTFTSRVLGVTRTIPFGRVVSYGEVAKEIGDPRASRAVGGALGRNPVPIIVPCHRVIGHARRLGGFTGGLSVKRVLLEIEGHTMEVVRRAAARDRRSPDESGARLADVPVVRKVR